jgi:Na+/serine symporter
MKNKLFFLTSTATTVLVSFILAVPVGAEELTKDDLLLKDPLGNNISGASTAETEIYSLVGEVISYALWAVGALAVIFLIYGGLSFAMSGGDTEKVKKAKSIILYSVIGLALAILANVIINLVVSVTGAFKY